MFDYFSAYFGQLFRFDKFLSHPFIRRCLRFMLFLYAVTDIQFYFQQSFDCFTWRFYFENDKKVVIGDPVRKVFIASKSKYTEKAIMI